MNRTDDYFATICAVLLVLLATTVTRNADASNPPAEKFIRQLSSNDSHVRINAETQLFELGIDAVDALVEAVCGAPSADPFVAEAALQILRKWETDSWTNPHSEAAIERFVELVRDPRNYSGEHSPLSPDAPYAFAEAVRVLDVPADRAAAYLRERGVRVSMLPGGYYSSVTLPRDWIPDPKDWLYIANLSQKGFEKHHPIIIDVVGPVDGDTLVECLKYFRKSKSRPFRLSVPEADLNREALAVLRSYRELLSFSYTRSGAIPDDDWAACVASWRKADSLDLPAVGPKTIAAVSKLESLLNLMFKDPGMTGADLDPLRDHEKLRVLWVFNGKRYDQYLNQKGTGIWQQESEGKQVEAADNAE